MFAHKRIVNNLFKKCVSSVNKIQIAKIYNRELIGNREWVGFGINGSAHYCDEPQFPCPAIRFKEFTNELLALREKEKGDWRKLCLEEKKTLYRASFRQTFAEVYAPTGEWKYVTGWVFLLLSFGLWLSIIINLTVYHPLPVTFSEEHRAARLRRIIDLKMGHLYGVSSKWDYEKDDWKK